jgi:hypothetical protein
MHLAVGELLATVDTQRGRRPSELDLWEHQPTPMPLRMCEYIRAETFKQV